MGPWAASAVRLRLAPSEMLPTGGPGGHRPPPQSIRGPARALKSSGGKARPPRRERTVLPALRPGWSESHSCLGNVVALQGCPKGLSRDETHSGRLAACGTPQGAWQRSEHLGVAQRSPEPAPQTLPGLPLAVSPLLPSPRSEREVVQKEDRWSPTHRSAWTALPSALPGAQRWGPASPAALRCSQPHPFWRTNHCNLTVFDTKLAQGLGSSLGDQPGPDHVKADVKFPSPQSPAASIPQGELKNSQGAEKTACRPRLSPGLSSAHPGELGAVGLHGGRPARGARDVSSPPAPLAEGKGDPRQGTCSQALPPRGWAGSPRLRLWVPWRLQPKTQLSTCGQNPRDCVWPSLSLPMHRCPSLTRRHQGLGGRPMFRKGVCSGAQAASSGQRQRPRAFLTGCPQAGGPGRGGGWG